MNSGSMFASKVPIPDSLKASLFEVTIIKNTFSTFHELERSKEQLEGGSKIIILVLYVGFRGVAL